MKTCFYCDKEGTFIVDDDDGMFFLCKKHYKLFLAKYGQKSKKKIDNEL